jgi:hypothetical protein
MLRQSIPMGRPPGGERLQDVAFTGRRGAAKSFSFLRTWEHMNKITRRGLASTFVGAGAVVTWPDCRGAVRPGLSDFGYVEGKTIILENRFR